MTTKFMLDARSGIWRCLIQHWILTLCTLSAGCIFLQFLGVIYQRWYLKKCPIRSSLPQRPPLIKSTIPYIGHFISNAISYQGYMSELAERYPRCSALSLKMMSSTHHVIIAPSLVHQVLTAQKITSKFSGEPFFFGLMEKVFGDEDQLMRKMDQSLLWGPVSKSVQGMMRESFLKPALQSVNDGVSKRVGGLISFEAQVANQQVWERAASVQPSADGTAATASLHPLLRDFVGTLAIDILLGPDFMHNYPTVLSDLFTLDAAFSMMLSGVPVSLASSLKSGIAARQRLLKALRDHHIAYMKSIHGQDPGSKWSRVDQTSNVIGERIQGFAQAGDFDDTKPEKELGKLSAVGNLVVLWALNVNANQVTFWMIFHIYSSDELLEDIRAEIDPFVVDGGKSRLKIDSDSLLKKCPLLMGAFLETMRWESGATVYRCISEDFVLSESAEDGEIFGHEVPQTYIFKKGEFIVVPNGTHQNDERYFRNSKKFDARRFWVRNEWEAKQPVEADIEDETSVTSNWHSFEKRTGALRGSRNTMKSPDGPVKVDYKTMHPWGGGFTVCKGKRFAEGEVLTFVAAIVAKWNIVRLDTSGIEIPSWGEHPGHRGGTGAVVPASDIYVRLSVRT